MEVTEVLVYSEKVTFDLIQAGIHSINPDLYTVDARSNLVKSSMYFTAQIRQSSILMEPSENNQHERPCGWDQ